MKRAGFAVVASLLLPSVLAAQEPPDPVRVAAARDAERYASCYRSGDRECLAERSFREPYAASGSQSRDVNAYLGALVVENFSASGIDTSGLVAAGLMVPGGEAYFWFEVAEPWPPFAVDAALYAYVPYFASFESPASGRRVDRMSYLIGHSADDGESWRFFPVRHELSSKEIDRVIPDHEEVPRPEFRDVVIKESRPERSRSLATTFRQILPVDELHSYVLVFGFRELFATPVDVTVHYDNPANPDESSTVRGSLAPGQTELRWQSPPMEGLEAGRTYEVAIEGRDPDTGSLLFEHREELLLPPTRELWLSVMSKPPTGQQ